MRLKTLLVTNAVLLGASGACAVLMPARMVALYGVKLGPEVVMMARYAGLGSLAIALVAWFSRNVQAPEAQRGIVVALLITFVIGTVISLVDTLSHVMKIGWPVVGTYAVFALAYAYVFFFNADRSGGTD